MCVVVCCLILSDLATSRAFATNATNRAISLVTEPQGDQFSSRDLDMPHHLNSASIVLEYGSISCAEDQSKQNLIKFVSWYKAV